MLVAAGVDYLFNLEWWHERLPDTKGWCLLQLWTRLRAAGRGFTAHSYFSLLLQNV